MSQPFTATGSPPEAPVHLVNTGSDFDSGNRVESGIGLCLSGGGYRCDGGLPTNLDGDAVFANRNVLACRSDPDEAEIPSPCTRL